MLGIWCVLSLGNYLFSGVIGSLGGGFLARKIAEEVIPAPEETQLAIEDEKKEEEVGDQYLLLQCSLSGRVSAKLLQ